MANLFKKTTLICDLDMTLLDSRWDIAIAMNHALGVVAGKNVEPETLFTHVGKSLRSTFVTVFPGASEEALDACIKEYKAYFYDHCDVKTTLFPGVIDTLTKLRSAGIKTAVATTKLSFMAKRVVEKFNIGHLFDLVQGTDDMPLKPDPAVILRVCDKLGVSPEESVMVGDTVMDVQAANAAGTTSVGVTYGIGDREQLIAAKPDYMIDAFSELMPLFEDEG